MALYILLTTRKEHTSPLSIQTQREKEIWGGEATILLTAAVVRLLSLPLSLSLSLFLPLSSPVMKGVTSLPPTATGAPAPTRYRNTRQGLSSSVLTSAGPGGEWVRGREKYIQ